MDGGGGVVLVGHVQVRVTEWGTKGWAHTGSESSARDNSSFFILLISPFKRS